MEEGKVKLNVNPNIEEGTQDTNQNPKEEVVKSNMDSAAESEMAKEK